MHTIKFLTPTQVACFLCFTRRFTGAINATLEDGKAREEVRAYQAGVSYMDHCVGSVVAALKQQGRPRVSSSLWEDTVVLFWSDHGWKLGQHGAWSKHTNFRTDTHAPVMLRVPGLTDGGLVSDALVEHVDLMPSLLDAAGLGTPPLCPEAEPWLTDFCSEGISFLPLASEPNKVWKNASYSQYPRQLASATPLMGYSMHVKVVSQQAAPTPSQPPVANLAAAAAAAATQEALQRDPPATVTSSNMLRFTAWVDFDAATNTTNFTMTKSSKCAFELYDHGSDPDENVNLAGAYTSDAMAAKVQGLFQQLRAGWRATASALD